jgi:type I restriction enzyme, S subunit
MSKRQTMLLQKAIQFNPSESIPKGKSSKKVPMGALTEFQRKINEFEFAEYNSGPKFRNRDTLVAKITPCLENGKTAYVDILENDEIAFGSSEFIVLRNTEFTDSEFIYYFARSPLFREKAISCMEGTSGRKRVNEKSLKNFEFNFPILADQKKIASILSALDLKIELNNKINIELESMAKTLYDYWFVQFDFPNEEEKPYKSSGGEMVWSDDLNRNIPKKWEVKELGAIISRSGTGLNPRDNFKLGLGNNYYITIKNVKGGKIIFDDTSDKVDNEALKIIDNRSDLQVGDILFTSIEPVGITYFIHEKPRNWNINESVFTIRPNYEKVTSEFLYMLLSSDEMKTYTKNVSTGSIHKGVRHSILKMFKLAYFDKKLIDNFSSIISPVLLKINKINQENQKLIELRDWLLPMLMNEQVTVK